MEAMTSDPVSPPAHRGCVARLAIAAALLACTLPATAQQSAPSSSVALPNAPEVQQQRHSRRGTFLGIPIGPLFPSEAGKYDPLIDATQSAAPLNPVDKLKYALDEQTRAVVLVPAFVAAGYGQLADSHPHVGTDAGGFGERLGTAALRQASDRLTGDGLFAAILQQDPRFYRVGDGPYGGRMLHAVSQTLLRKTGAEGVPRVNASGLLGHAFGSALTVAYYPRSSARASVAAQTFGTAVAGDAISKVLLEFLPDLVELSHLKRRDSNR